jgi:hypothetical protein
MTSTVKVWHYQGAERCALCVQDVREMVREFDLDPAGTDLSALPVAVFETDGDFVVCPSHLVDAVRLDLAPLVPCC